MTGDIRPTHDDPGSIAHTTLAEVAEWLNYKPIWNAHYREYHDQVNEYLDSLDEMGEKIFERATY